MEVSDLFVINFFSVEKLAEVHRGINFILLYLLFSFNTKLVH